ncbi:deoxyxylulose-5-phosphate synthase [Burkholderia lata]|uniref:1-deoxy-D-xylulose-5-phosphate synthase n=1 Tax=Burkholderia lata (strain ATCC 17760 / DSM 23089 / LMG 22485 / NCIMB 9086 / R18194 / 383) TaxID=482957 RepID=UPI0014543BA8|nr:1-deoxy-D-xylulose-5-phosphate synthase [Burkholderia lata]VWD04456.1 deoxyxylulose-5-phosphate synthase [Burkholderia lata]
MTDIFLQNIGVPDDLRALPRAALSKLAEEVRAFVLDSVSKTGGHLSSNLGSVELAIALHYVFDTPHDRVVWDVGHQSYPHKILTGRREVMATIRRLGGISGFPSRAESEYDAFGTAHSSTSISAVLGMAYAARLSRTDRHCIAVIGDGALSAGMAFEALNNAGVAESLPMIVVLNDNDMSISPPVGALRHALGRLTTTRAYTDAKRHAQAVLDLVPSARRLANRAEAQMKGLLAPATFFEELGFNYVGPFNGHDVDELVDVLTNLKHLPGPHLMHVVTRKGCGYPRAEADPIQYHGPGKFDPTVGIEPGRPGRKTYAQVFSDWLCDEARRDDRVVAITPAMREGSGLVEFERQFPARYFDVAIAEQHAVTFAAGLAADGMRPVVAIYSTFLQRGYDQLIHDVAIQNLPVTFAIDRAGIVGADGATHMGAFDLAYLRCIPNLVIMAPSSEDECRQMLHTALHHSGPAAVRYPRGTGPGVTIEAELTALPIGVSMLRRSSSAIDGQRVAFVAFGTMVGPCLVAAEAFDATVVDMRFVKPLDTARLREIASTHDVLVTVEEGCLSGGAGAACVEALADAQLFRPVLRLGLPDTFIAHGEPAQLLALYGLDARGIQAAVKRFMPRQDSVERPMAVVSDAADRMNGRSMYPDGVG